jgi:hypothetical protein
MITGSVHTRPETAAFCTELAIMDGGVGETGLT